MAGDHNVNPEVEDLLIAATRVPPHEREEFLAKHCPDPAVRSEVEALLRDASAAERYFENAVQSVAVSLSASRGLSPGDAIGSYRIVSLIGSGGMGTVYLAERSDGEIQQKVAIKLLRADGYLPVFRDRFLKERQLLASLHHASIVAVLDAGHTEHGWPYLVMEYVEGTAIDTYAEQIPVRERLNLFLRVCEGVSHAHRHLIIHRDLKPSNILVDGSGQPKLLDFGIAKLLQDTGDATQTVERLLTPNYASPEQLRGAAQSTATDVYSLGAVLYKLLTGAAPRQADSPAANDSIPAPSRTNPDVPRDVDFIVHKALRVEPEERYASVDDFAADIRAALEWRPVRARSGDVWYRTRRFLRRYWVPVAAAALVVFSLSAGLYVANRERSIAERRFVEVRQLSNKLFDIDDQVSRLPGGTKVRQYIVETSLEYLQRVAADLRMEPALALEIGGAYMRVARVQRVAIGQTQQADQTARKAEALIDSVLAAQPQNPVALLRSAQIAQDRLLMSRHLQPKIALQFAQKATTQVEKYLQVAKLDGPTKQDDAIEVILTYLNAGNEFIRAEYFDEAIRASHRVIDIARAVNARAYEGAAQMNLALAYRSTGKLDQSLQAIREALQILKPPPGQQGGGRSFAYISALIHQGRILGEAGGISLDRPQEAVASLQEAIDVAEVIARRDPNEFSSRERIFSASVLGANILRHSDPQRALAMCDHALQRLAESKESASARLHEVEVMVAASYALQRLGRSVEARQRLDAAFQVLREFKLYPATQIRIGSEPDSALRALADYHATTGNARLAADLYQQLLSLLLAGNPKPESSLADAVALSNLYGSAAPLLRRAANMDAAAVLESNQRQLWQAWDRKLPNNAFVRRQLAAAHPELLALHPGK